MSFHFFWGRPRLLRRPTARRFSQTILNNGTTGTPASLAPCSTCTCAAKTLEPRLSRLRLVCAPFSRFSSSGTLSANSRRKSGRTRPRIIDHVKLVQDFDSEVTCARDAQSCLQLRVLWGASRQCTRAHCKARAKIRFRSMSVGLCRERRLFFESQPRERYCFRRAT